MVISENPTLTPVAARLAVELSLPVLTTYVCSDRGSNPDPRMRDERSTAKYTDDFCKALKSM